MNSEYDRLIGKKMVGLADWNALCLELGLKMVYPSITQCQAVCYIFDLFLLCGFLVMQGWLTLYAD